MFSSNDVDELESHNDGKSKISYRHEPGRRIVFIWMSQYPMSSSAKIQQILRRYTLLFLLWDTPLLFDLIKQESCYPVANFTPYSSIPWYSVILGLKVNSALKSSLHVFYHLGPSQRSHSFFALNPLKVSPLAHVFKAELSAEPAGCGSLLNHSHGTG